MEAMAKVTMTTPILFRINTAQTAAMQMRVTMVDVIRLLLTLNNKSSNDASMSYGIA